MKKSVNIIIIFIVILVYSIGFVAFIQNFYPDLDLGITILLYFVFLMLFLGPFLPRKNKPSLIGHISNKMKEKDEDDFFKLDLDKKINLDVTYETPLISRCRCGFMLSSKMHICPNCGRENPNYTG